MLAQNYSRLSYYVFKDVVDGSLRGNLGSVGGTVSINCVDRPVVGGLKMGRVVLLALQAALCCIAQGS